MLLMTSACELMEPADPVPEPDIPAPPEPHVRTSPQPIVVPVAPRPQPQPAPQALVLLDLVAQVIESDTPEARRAIEQAERARYEADPTANNRLRLAIVRAYGATLPADLHQTRKSLEALADADDELDDHQRQMVLVALTMVDERLQLGEQILSLQQQIDSLTEIEASMNHQEATEPATEDAP